MTSSTIPPRVYVLLLGLRASYESGHYWLLYAKALISVYAVSQTHEIRYEDYRKPACASAGLSLGSLMDGFRI